MKKPIHNNRCALSRNFYFTRRSNHARRQLAAAWRKKTCWPRIGDAESLARVNAQFLGDGRGVGGQFVLRGYGGVGEAMLANRVHAGFEANHRHAVGPAGLGLTKYPASPTWKGMVI